MIGNAARFARLTLGCLCTTTLVVAAQAQTPYPQRPVQAVVGFSAGGTVDVMARALVASMSAILGQTIAITNREGAAGTIGFGQVAAAAPDGYLHAAGPTTPISIAPHLMKNLQFNAESFEYVCQSFENVFTVSVPLNSPHRTVADLIAAARANPGKLAYGHSGVGTVPHLSVANLASRSGVDMTAVAYKGENPMMPDVISGRLDFGALSVGATIGQKVRVLAVFADGRHPSYPDAPTFAELGMPSMPPGLNGLFAPKGTPRAVMATLEKACEQAVASESFRAAAQRLHQRVAYLPGPVFAERTVADAKYKGELIRALGIRAE
jgi:tripartite-type tricarboxylate transporter receptor subunit TctC